jgi:uncharacterized protein YqgC (DUF456 family)
MGQLGWEITVGVCLSVLNVVGVGLTALLLPGIWVMLLGAGLAQWWHMAQYGTEMYSWWTLGVCAAVAVIAEVIELVASGLGASKFGGTKTGALWSVVGAILGAMIGSIVLVLVGTIIGAAVGAFAGALLGERLFKKRSWAEASKSGAGAAIGRLAATLVKVGLAVVVGAVLSVGAFV